MQILLQEVDHFCEINSSQLQGNLLIGFLISILADKFRAGIHEAAASFVNHMLVSDVVNVFSYYNPYHRVTLIAL